VGAPHIHDVPSPTLTVVEFADFQCPSCRKAYDVLLRKLKQEKSVRFIFHHLPLVGMHERAMPAAMAAEAADKQGKFWEMYDALFDGLKTELTDDDIDKCARKAGLDMTKFKNDLNDSASRARIEADLKMAASYHIGSTPTFVVKDSKDAVFQVVGAQELQAALVREGIAL
jgi:protein-disulfide isomerase